MSSIISFSNDNSGSNKAGKDSLTVLLLCALGLTILTIPAFRVIPLPELQQADFLGVDFSYSWLQNYLWAGDFNQLQDTHFPHGVMGFLQYLWPLSSHYTVGVVCIGLLRYMQCLVLFYIFQKKLSPFLSLALSYLLILPLTLSQGLMFSALQLIILLYVERKPLYLYALAFFIAAAFYIRLFPFLFCLTSFLSGILLAPSKQFFKHYALSLLIAIMGIAIVWVALFGTFSSLASDLQFNFQLIQGGPFATSLYPTNNRILLLLSFLSLFIALYRLTPLKLFLIMLASIFLLFKYAFGHEDYAHLWVFLKIVYPALLVLLLIQPGRITASLVVVSALTFYANAGMVSGKFSLNLPNLNFYKSWSAYLDRDLALKQFKAQTLHQRQIHSLNLPDSLIAYSAAVFPFDYLYPILNHHAVKASPVSQSQIAYTPWLDSRQAQFFQGTDAPELVYMHNPPGDSLSLNQQYYQHISPTAQDAIHKNYRLIKRWPSVSLYLKKPPHVNNQKIDTLSLGPEDLNKWLKLQPANETILIVDPDCIDFLFNLKALLYKPGRALIFFRLLNGKELRFDLNLKLAQKGLPIAPFYLDRDRLRASEVQAIKVEIY